MPSGTGTPGAAGVCEDRRWLLERAAACEEQAAALDPSRAGVDRAHQMLTATAAHCRHAATVYDLGPTLADEPWREVDLLVELARQVPPLLRNALSDRGLDRWPTEVRWAEAEALFARLGPLTDRIVTELPRRDHATAAGSQAISRARLAGNTDQLRRAAATIRDALGPATLRLPHPAPEVAALARLADEIDAHATALDEPSTSGRSRPEAGEGGACNHR